MSFLDHYDLRRNLDRIAEAMHVLPPDDYTEGHETLKEQLATAAAAEGAQDEGAYYDYVTLAALALNRAYLICDARRGPPEVSDDGE